MMKTRPWMMILLGILCFALVPRNAGAQLPNGYGAAIGVETARKIAAAAAAEGKKNGWNVAVAIVDPAGELVFFERMDNTQAGSIAVSQDKARTAARFKRPTKAFEDALVGGRQAILGLPGVVPLEGGIPPTATQHGKDTILENRFPGGQVGLHHHQPGSVWAQIL